MLIGITRCGFYEGTPAARVIADCEALFLSPSPFGGRPGRGPLDPHPRIHRQDFIFVA
jgi:hypothetical protein